MKRDIETREMRHRLATYVEQDAQHSLAGMLQRLLRDPIRPRTDRGRFRVSLILLLLSVLLVFSLVTFLCFSTVHP